MNWSYHVVDKTLAKSAITGLCPMTSDALSAGRVVVTADPSGDHLNPAGTVHGGFAATLLGICMGLPVQTRIKKASVQRPWNSRSLCR